MDSNWGTVCRSLSSASESRALGPVLWNMRHPEPESYAFEAHVDSEANKHPEEADMSSCWPVDSSRAHSGDLALLLYTHGLTDLTVITCCAG